MQPVKANEPKRLLVRKKKMTTNKINKFTKNNTLANIEHNIQKERQRDFRTLLSIVVLAKPSPDCGSLV